MMAMTAANARPATELPRNERHAPVQSRLRREREPPVVNRLLHVEAPSNVTTFPFPTTRRRAKPN